MAPLPRIMVVDHRHEIGPAVQATLALLDLRAVVTEVPSSEDAVLEMQRAPHDLMVASYKLPDTNGLDLARIAADEAPGMSVIVIADIDDPVPDDDALSQALYTVLVKPLAADRLSRALRAALGEEVEEAPPAAAPVEDLGPVPDIDLEELRGILSALLTDVGAMALVLMDRNGQLLLELGAVGYLDREKLTSVLAPSFAAMVHIVDLVGGEPWGMYFWDGDQFDIYGLSLGLHHFVCLVFEATVGNRALGSVTIYGKRAIEEMLKSVGPAAFEIHKPAPAKAEPRRAEPPAPRLQPPVKSAPPAAPAPARAEPRRAEPPVAPALKPQPAPPPSAPPPVIEVDDRVLKAALGKLQSVDVDAFWDSAVQSEASVIDVTGEDALSFEEALQMGLLPPEMGPEE